MIQPYVCSGAKNCCISSYCSRRYLTLASDPPPAPYLGLYGDCDSEELPIEWRGAEEVAALGVGDVVGCQRGARGNLQLVRVEVLEGNGVEVVALFRVA